MLTIGSYNMGIEMCLEQEQQQRTVKEQQNISGSRRDVAEVAEAQGMVADLAGLIEGLQRHLDERLDKVDRSLAEHDARLGMIEDRLEKYQ